MKLQKIKTCQDQTRNDYVVYNRAIVRFYLFIYFLLLFLLLLLFSPRMILFAFYLNIVYHIVCVCEKNSVSIGLC